MNDDEDLLFLDEESSDFSPELEQDHDPRKDAWKVMIVDDDEEIHSVTKLVLCDFEFQGKPLQIIDVYSGREAIEAIANNPDTALILLDIVMETDHAGLKVARAVREEVKNTTTRIVLRTGQPGQAPEKEIIENYDINDYKDKTELTSQKLITLLFSTLRSYADIITIKQQKKDNEEFYKQTLQQLENSKKHIFSIIDSMPSVLIGLDEQLKVSDWNKQAALLSGVSMQQAVGQPLLDIFPPAKHFKNLVEKALQQQHEQIADKVMLTVNKQQYYYFVASYPIKMGDKLGAVLRMDDMTSRLEKENMMVQSEKLATIGGLAAGMAQEIKNPLGLIIQNTQNVISRINPQVSMNQEVAASLQLNFNTLQDYLQQRKVIKFIENMREAADQAMGLINNMLGFGLAEDADMKYSPIQELIEEALALVRKDFEVKRIYNLDHHPIEVVVEEDLPDIPCIRPQIVQVLVNICKFAVHDVVKQANPPIIKIHATNLDNTVEFTISENGNSYSQQELNSLFDSSPCEDNSSKNTAKRLAMSVCHYIITDQHNGCLKAKSLSELGTQFHFTLPKSLKSSQLR